MRMKNEHKKTPTAHDIHPNKLMGQHFLVSKTVLEKILMAAELSKNDTVLEVGPGLGALTLELSRRTERVIAVEKDRTLAAALKKILAEHGRTNVSVVEKDLLRIPVNELVRGPYKIVANLPYYLTSRFLRMFIADTVARPEEIVVVIQREVAERVVAQPPEMGLLSLSVQTFGTPQIISFIPADAFSPPPKVESAILRITDISPRFFLAHALDEKKFFSLARTAFQQKRKMLANSLTLMCEGKAAAEKILAAAHIPGGARPQELSLDDWARLCTALPASHQPQSAP